MSKNKFMKKLLIAGLCAVTATAMVGATACKDKPEEDGHVHNYATTWKSDKDGHWHECLNAGHTGAYEKINHVDSNNDNKCDECEYVLSTENPNPGPDNPDDPDKPTTPATEKVAINVSDLTAVADNAEIVTGSGIYSTGGLGVTQNSKTILYNGTEVTVSNRLQTNGTGKIDTKSLKFEIAKDNSLIVLYAISGSTGVERSLFLKDAEGNDVETQSVGEGNYVNTVVFEIAKAGTYYVGSVNSGINFYHISVWEDGKLNETVVETKEAAPATCTTPGNIAYTKTNFGRYKDGTGKVVTQDKISSPALNHDYALDNASLVVPTETAVGTIKILCNRDHTHDYDFELPVLTNDGYVKVTQGQEAGKALYGYAVPGTDLTVSFVADDVAQQEATWTDLYKNDFTEAANVTYGNLASATATGIYGNTDETGYTAFDTTYNVNVADGVLKITDLGAKTTNAWVVLSETAVSNEIVKISAQITFPAKNGSWSIMQLVNSQDKEILSLRTVSSGLLGVRSYKDNAASSTATSDALALDKNDVVTVEIVYDIAVGSAKVTINNTTKNASKTYDVTVDANGELKALKFVTAGSATDRSFTVDDILVQTKD